jgi:hypothetical protein
MSRAKGRFDTSHGDESDGEGYSSDYYESDVAPSPTSLGAVFGEALRATALQTAANDDRKGKKKAQQLKKAVAAAAAAERKASAAASAAAEAAAPSNPFELALTQSDPQAIMIVDFLTKSTKRPNIDYGLTQVMQRAFEKAHRSFWMPEIARMRNELLKSSSKKGGYRNKSHKKRRSHKKRKSYKTRR